MSDDNDNIQNKLNDYAKEIGLDELSIVQLISSHRRLREMNTQNVRENNKEHAKVLKEQKERAFAYALENNFVSKEKLKSMTMAELVEFLQED